MLDSTEVITPVKTDASDCCGRMSLVQDQQCHYNTASRYNIQGNIISTPWQMKESAYAVWPRTDRDWWSTWAS